MFKSRVLTLLSILLLLGCVSDATTATRELQSRSDCHRGDVDARPAARQSACRGFAARRNH